MRLRNWMITVGVLGLMLSPSGVQAKEPSEELLAGHPRASYENVKDIDAMAAALRKSLAGLERHSFSRGWWGWDRLRARWVDDGRKDKNAACILQAVFRGLILDRHAKLKAKGEGDLLYIFFSTLRGDKRESVLDVKGRKVLRDLHGGGYHGSWGSAARMRIYEELVKARLLTKAEQALFKQIVHQSLDGRFINFREKHQNATNHAFGNAGGIAIALRLFPDVPQAKEARAWLGRMWKDLADFGDWKEWTYYPYGPIFLHGFVDLAEEGRLKTDRELVYAIGRRALGFVHGGGVRGNPNSGANATFPTGTDRQKEIYSNPWNRGYYRVETDPRDGHFWYRMAQHFKDPEFLWAAEQVALGGRPPDGKVPPEYVRAYNNRFAWFNQRGIKPKAPDGKSAVGLISPLKHKIPERLYLCPGRQSGKPFVSFFIFDSGGSHSNDPETRGELYEYCVGGAKLLHTSGKYTDDLPGGSGNYDSLMVIKPNFQFPIDPKVRPNGPEALRSGKLIRSTLRAENQGGDSFGQFGFSDYFGAHSGWTRQAVLTAEGCLVVRDVYKSAKATDGYQAGPCWQLASEKKPPLRAADQNWFDAPAWDHAWWQKQKKRVLLYLHPGKGLTFGQAPNRASQDIGGGVHNSFAKAIVKAGKPQIWLSVLVPFNEGEDAAKIAGKIKTSADKAGKATAHIGNVKVTIDAAGKWQVTR